MNLKHKSLVTQLTYITIKIKYDINIKYTCTSKGIDKQREEKQCKTNSSEL